MTDPIQDALDQAPKTPAALQAAWFLTRVHGRGEGATLAEYDRYTPEVRAQAPRATNDEETRTGWANFADRVGAFEEVAFTVASELEADVRVLSSKDRRWRLSLVVEAEPPHRVTRLDFERQHDFELAVREAEPADALTLSDLESRCPIVLDDTRIWFDRGERYFDFSRLMADCTVGLATVDGEPGAVTCGARHVVRIGGVPKTIITVSHLRVLPEHQRKGMWGAANRILDKYWPTVDGSNAYISVENAGMQHGFRHTPDKWPHPFRWARLDTARSAGPAFGRPSRPADASAIARALNRFHGDQEMFVPYTEETLTARLERAPDLYGWDKIWLADGALVGVWPAGRAMRIVTERGGTQTHSEPGVALDYAFEPGAEANFEALLRAWCAHLAERGMDRLSIFTSPGSPGFDLIVSLAAEVELYNMWTPGIPVPADAADKGLYVDPVYF